MENREKTAMAEPDEVKFLAVLLESFIGDKLLAV